MVKLCTEDEAGFAFAARLRGLDGKPLPAVRISVAGADLALAARRQGTKAGDAIPDLGARSAWLPLAEKGDALAARRLAYLLFTDQVDGDFKRRDEKFAEAAVAAHPDDAEARLVLAHTRIRHGGSQADRDENQRRADYEELLRRHPDDVEALLELGHLELDNTGICRHAAALADKALTVDPDCVQAHALDAEVLAARNQTQLALRELTRLGAATDPTVPVLQRLASAADDASEDKLLLQAQTALAQRTGAADAHCALARSLFHAGDRQAGVAQLQLATELDPTAREPRALLAALLASEGDLAAALQTWTAWLTLCPDDDDALVQVSHLHGRLGDRDKQIETLRAALELNPNRRDEQRWLEFLAAEQTPFYQPYQLDGEVLLKADPGPPADAGDAHDPVYHLLEQRVVRAYRNGTTSDYRHTIVRVLNEAGAQSLQRYRLPYWYGEQRARLLACTIHKADDTALHPNLGGAVVALPALQPGDTIDIEGRIDDLAPTFFGDYFGLEQTLMSPDGSPLRRSQLVVIADPGREYRLQSANGAPEAQQKKLADGSTEFRWEMRDLPRDHPEPREPGSEERDPLVRVTTYRTWDQFAGWWWHLIKEQLEVTPEMRQKVAELTKGLQDETAKIAAIYRFVTTEVRYEAWEFGVHGYKPYSTAVIYERRHGDCKDKALLLCALLGEIGVHADPVLIRADPGRTEDDLTLPLIGHFNHCITWLPPAGDRKGMFLDGTATWHPIDTVPEMDQGAKVVVVDDGKAELKTIAYCDPAADADDDTYDIELQAAGDATVNWRSQPRGNQAVDVRADLATEPARRREHLEQRLVRIFGKAELLDLQASDPLQLDVPIQFTARFHAPELARPEGNGLVLKSSFSDSGLQALVSEPTRTTPLLLGIPRSWHRVVRYHLPPGMQPAKLPAKVTESADFGEFAMQWQLQGDTLAIERQLTLKSPRITPADYAAFRDFVSSLRAADGSLVVLERKDGGR
jgi:tetratricopeptide (TPR) repeat protein